MSPWAGQEVNLPQHLEKLRQEAKQLARATQYKQSSEKNLQLEKESREHPSDLGEVLGMRFRGLCAYRLEDLPGSETLLCRALEMARLRGLHQQELYIANHLGATLRRLGKLDEAYDMFRDALDKVRLPGDIEAKARLTGNLGAFYDEIGNEQGADDCYARYEELVELLVMSGDVDDGARLANARALSARAALRRGDWETARKKHDDEFKLAHDSKDQLRKRNAVFHRAKMRLHLGLRAQRNKEDPTEYFKDARLGLEEAKKFFQKNEQYFRLADVLHHQGRMFEAQEQWADAYGAWREAFAVSARSKHEYRRAQTCLVLARFCQSWAFHGESLHWFGEAARIHSALYAPIAASKRVAGIAHTRVVELGALATSLLHEARSVDRERDELVRVQALVNAITGRATDAVSIAKNEDVYAWQKRIRDESRERWQMMLSKPRFERLKQLSQDDLVMADMLYHGVIDELPRSALLIAIVVERELRERLFVPLYDAYGSRRSHASKKLKAKRSSTTSNYLNANHKEHAPLGSALHIIDEILGKEDLDDAVKFAKDETMAWRDNLRCIQRLGKPVELLDGSTSSVDLRTVRNAAAHGTSGPTGLNRSTVDALKRRLVLDSPMIMASIIDLELPRKT